MHRPYCLYFKREASKVEVLNQTITLIKNKNFLGLLVLFAKFSFRVCSFFTILL